MSTTASFLDNHLACIACQAPLAHDMEECRCTGCDMVYPMASGIPDCYPRASPYTPRNINIRHQYEGFGEEQGLSETWHNLRRRRLTVDLVDPSDSVLEIGCAEGWMTESLVERASVVVGSDIALNFLQRARENVPAADYVLLDAHHLPFLDASFSCVVMTEVLEHVYAPYGVLEEIYRVLEPGGHLVLSVPNHLNVPRLLQHLRNRQDKSHDAHFSAFDYFSLDKLLDFAGFKVNATYADYIHVPVIKRFFANDRMQDRLQKRWRYFGNRLIVRAVKAEDSLWTRL